MICTGGEPWFISLQEQEIFLICIASTSALGLTYLSPHSLDTVAFVLVAGGCGAKMISQCIHCVCGTDGASGEEGGQSCCLGKQLDNLWLGCCLLLNVCHEISCMYSTVNTVRPSGYYMYRRV